MIFPTSYLLYGHCTEKKENAFTVVRENVITAGYLPHYKNLRQLNLFETIFLILIQKI